MRIVKAYCADANDPHAIHLMWDQDSEEIKKAELLKRVSIGACGKTAAEAKSNYVSELEEIKTENNNRIQKMIDLVKNS